MMLYYHGAKNKTGPPSAPRHTACKVVWAVSFYCLQHLKNKILQRKEKDAHSVKPLGANKQAVDFVPRYKVGRLFFAFPHSVGNRGPPDSRLLHQ